MALQNNPKGVPALHRIKQRLTASLEVEAASATELVAVERRAGPSLLRPQQIRTDGRTDGRTDVPNGPPASHGSGREEDAPYGTVAGTVADDGWRDLPHAVVPNGWHATREGARRSGNSPQCICTDQLQPRPSGQLSGEPGSGVPDGTRSTSGSQCAKPRWLASWVASPPCSGE
jgi:hypothetical protein